MTAHQVRVINKAPGGAGNPAVAAAFNILIALALPSR
jgi:hypothetical protein